MDTIVGLSVGTNVGCSVGNVVGKFDMRQTNSVILVVTTVVDVIFLSPLFVTNFFFIRGTV